MGAIYVVLENQKRSFRCDTFIDRINHRESTYWSPHLVFSTFSKYMVGPRSLACKPLKVQKSVMPDLKALMCVKLREEN